ncbi:hypothetical protein BpHYR1_039730 [Brachionus plicatilis]|uniref:Uncharacterized protein n=1 Tax=Brachionus plicatilis TaxID=10195 RepID=A0A3M7T635_BRAPC|nr:hypothetical protein BpHYR1_039730 [Brachionus plicatilis]
MIIKNVGPSILGSLIHFKSVYFCFSQNSFFFFLIKNFILKKFKKCLRKKLIKKFLIACLTKIKSRKSAVKLLKNIIKGANSF